MDMSLRKELRKRITLGGKKDKKKEKKLKHRSWDGSHESAVPSIIVSLPPDQTPPSPRVGHAGDVFLQPSQAYAPQRQTLHRAKLKLEHTVVVEVNSYDIVPLDDYNPMANEAGEGEPTVEDGVSPALPIHTQSLSTTEDLVSHDVPSDTQPLLANSREPRITKTKAGFFCCCCVEDSSSQEVEQENVRGFDRSA